MTISNEDLRKRWHGPNGEVYVQRILRCFANGGSIAEYLSPFGLHENRIDFRGLEITPDQRESCSEVVGCSFEHVDFTGAYFGDAWTEGCLFDDVVFGEANMQDFRDLGNSYHNCSFTKTDFSGAGIGHGGSRYEKCVFKDVKFRRTRFIRAEFDNCIFDNCKLKNANFDASSFVSCEFIGKLYGVCFSNGYRLGSDLNEEFGIPRENRMLNVSFAKAELKTLSIDNGCDLSTIVMPEEGEYRLYDNFKKRMVVLQSRLGEFHGDERKQVEIFVEIYMETAQDQDMHIFNCDVLRKKYGDKLIEILDL